MITRRSRRLAPVAALAVAALTLTGCGRADDASDGATGAAAEDFVEGEATGSLTVWAMGSEGEALPAFLEAFEAENPDVDIEVLAVPWSAAGDQFRTAIASGTGPDVAMVGTDWMAEMGHAFETVPSNVDTSTFFDGAIDNATVDGELRGVPWYIDTRVMFYRTDLAAQAGWDQAPETGEEFVQFLQDLKEQTDVTNPIRLSVGVQGAFLDQLWNVWSHGADVINEDQTEWTFDTPEMAEAMEFYTSLFSEGLAPTAVDTTPGSTEAEFVSGQLGAFIGGPWMRGVLTNLGGVEFASKFSTAPVPSFESSTSFAGGANLVVFNDTDNRDAAWSLVNWLTRPETQVDFFGATGNLPTSELAWEDESLQQDDKLTAFYTQLQSISAPPQLATWPQVTAEADRQLERMIVGGVPVADALAELQRQADSIGMDH